MYNYTKLTEYKYIAYQMYKCITTQILRKQLIHFENKHNLHISPGNCWWIKDLIISKAFCLLPIASFDRAH